jgi:dTDP-4-amino-4,6-dideoxygalactose transaminase
MKALHQLSKEYGFRIIEDASHAVGACYLDEPVGNCRFSDIAVFSFHPVKIITTGEGGMSLTNDPELTRRMRLFRTHGISRDSDEMLSEPDGPWYYEQHVLGFNYRMTDLQAALGLSQMQRLDDFVARRLGVAKAYDSAFGSLPLVTPWQHPDGKSSWHLYVVRLKLGEISRTHREVFKRLRDAGIGVNLHYIPLYRQPFHKRAQGSRSNWPESERYYDEAISLPIYPGLTNEQELAVVEQVANTLAGQ